MTNTAAHPSLMERVTDWLRQETHAHNARSVLVDLVTKVHELEHRLAALEAVAVKDAPVGVHAAEEAATVVADVEKAAGTP